MRRGCGTGVKNYTSISCHSFLPSPPPSVAEQAQQLAQDAEQGADQIKVVEHGGYPMMGDWTASSGQGGVGYMTGFAACAVPETGPLMRQPRRDPSHRGFLRHKTEYRRVSSRGLNRGAVLRDETVIQLHETFSGDNAEMSSMA